MVSSIIRRILLLSITCCPIASHAVPVMLQNVDHLTSALQVGETNIQDTLLSSNFTQQLSLEGFSHSLADKLGSAGKGFSNKEKETGTVSEVNKMNVSEDIDTTPTTPKGCSNLTTIEGIRACYKIDTDQSHSSFDVRTVNNRVTDGRKGAITSLFSHAATIANKTSEFEKTKSNLEKKKPTTVSNALSHRGEMGLIMNVTQSEQFMVDISILEIEGLDIFKRINSVPVFDVTSAVSK